LTGYGILKTPTASYQGTWNSDMENGRGRMINEQATYEGEFVNGAAQGFGTQVDNE
jgi:hypothetical protein